jgi:putative isomerase
MIHKYADSDGLYIMLAERMTDNEPDLEAYLSRPPFIQNFYFIDDSGSPLTYHLISYPHALFFQTRLGIFSLAFHNVDTIAIGLPAGVCAGIRFSIHAQVWQKEEKGGSLKAARTLAYHTNGQILKNEVIVERATTRLEFGIHSHEDSTIHLKVQRENEAGPEAAPFTQTLNAAEKRWHDWFAKAPQVIDKFQMKYYYAWWVMANNLVTPLGCVTKEAMMPSKAKYVGIWNWDACFHVLAFRHIDSELARDQIRTILACQLKDGMVPDVVYDDGVVDQIEHPIPAKVTKPPIIAWAALKLHELHPSIEFLDEIYAPLVRWNEWWFKENDDDADGLAQYNHPYSSGLDDSPVWDHGMPVESPDLNTYLCVQMESLALMAKYLGMVDEARQWRRQSSTIVQHMMQGFYDPDAGLFLATHDHKAIQEVTLINLFPLWTGRLPLDIQSKILGHLTNKDEFWGPYPLATVARNTPSYSPETMWRGPTWANINYIFIEALTRIRRNDLANELRDKTLALIMKNEGIYEFYNSETGEPGENATPMFGWTAAIFIDLVLQFGKE